MSQTSVKSGELAPQTQSGGGALEKNGAYAPTGSAAPAGGNAPVRRGLSRLLLLPIVAAAVCGSGAFVASSYYMTHWYSTAETIWFPPTGNQGTAGILSTLVGGGGADASGSVPILGGLYSSPQFASGPNTAITALDSGRAKGEVLSKLKLASRWHLTPDQAVERFNKNVTYGIDKDGLLMIQATDTDPHLAYQIVNTYVQAMRDVSTQLSIAFAHRNLIAVRQKYAAAHADLLRQEDELVSLQKNRTAAMPLGSAATEQYADIAKQEATARIALNNTNAQIAAQIQTARKAYGSSLDLPTSVPFADSTIQDLRKAEDEFHRISAIYGPEYPGYREAQSRVEQAKLQAKAELQRQLSATTRFVSPDMAGLYVKRATAEADLASLRREAAARQADMLSLPAMQRREADLNREIAQSNALDATLYQAVTQAELAEKRDLPTYEVMDAAGVPGKPSLPRVGYTTALAAVAGFLLTMAGLTARVLLRQPTSQAQLRRWSMAYGLMEAEEVPILSAEEARAPLPRPDVPHLPRSDTPDEEARAALQPTPVESAGDHRL